jgi:cytochrome c oxidase subunit 2
MGTTAVVIAISYLVVVVIGIALALLLARSTRRRREADEAYNERKAHQEKRWLGVVVVLLAGLLFATVFFIPYGETAPANAQVVEVDSVQFGWLFPPAMEIKTDQPVLFKLTSQDVNHGFGVYKVDGDELLFQAQVVPGDVQEVVWTFDEPGQYEVLCLEFCGKGHQLMRSTFEVTQ